MEIRVPDKQTNALLEIEADEAFVSGAQAYPFIYADRSPDDPASMGAPGAIAHLSRQALQYAQA